MLSDRSIQFFDTETGKVKSEIRSTDSPEGGRWNALAIASQGHMLAIGGVDDANQQSILEVWRTPQPKPTSAMLQRIHHFPTGDPVKTIACSANGKLIAIANGQKPSAEVLDAATGKTVVSLKLTTNDEDILLYATNRTSYVESLAFSPDGSLLAIGTKLGQAKLFDARTGELVRSLHDQHAKYTDWKTRKPLKSPERAMGTVESLVFSPNGSLLAMCGSSFDDGALYDYDFERFELPTGPGRVKVWDVKTGTLQHDLAGHSHAHAVAFSPDGNLLAGAGSWRIEDHWGTGVTIWDPHTGAKIRVMLNGYNDSTWSVAFSPDSKLVVSGMRMYSRDEKDANATSVVLVPALAGRPLWQQPFSFSTAPRGFSPDGKSVAVLCDKRSIQFLDTETGKAMHEIRSADSGPGGEWNDFAIAPQANLLAIAGTDAQKQGFVEVWGTRSDVPMKSETVDTAAEPVVKAVEKPTEKPAEKPAGPVVTVEKPTGNAFVEISGHVVDEATGKTVPYFFVQRGFLDKKDPAKILWGGWADGRTSANLTGEFRFMLDWSAGDRAGLSPAAISPSQSSPSHPKPARRPTDW